jgi:hypothetical protein
VTEVGPPMFDINEDIRERLAAIRLLTKEAAELTALAVLEARIQVRHAEDVLDAVVTSRSARPQKRGRAASADRRGSQEAAKSLRAGKECRRRSAQ